jgi:hypothetical protein
MSCWLHRSCVDHLPPRPAVTAEGARPRTTKTTTTWTWTRDDRAPPRPPSLQHRLLLDPRSSFDLSLLLLHLLMPLHLPLLRSPNPNPTSTKSHPTNSLSNNITDHNHNLFFNNSSTCRPRHTLLHPRHPLSKNIPSTHHNPSAIQYPNLNC